MYGGKAESNTVYCCPGEAGEQERRQSLKIEGIDLPLLNDRAFRQFNDFLAREADTTVRVTLLGTFFSGRKQTVGNRTFWGGAGHLGCCSLFVVERVISFEPHTRKDVDYTAASGWYENEGCKWRSMKYIKHVSMADPESAKEAIAEQAAADTGSRSFAFSDPRQVAVESWTSLYKDPVPVFTNEGSTNLQKVFRTREKNRAVVIVVTRPYWLSFFSKGDTVAWISTTVKEADCQQKNRN